MARPGHIYVMRVDADRLKVGFSSRPVVRAAELGGLSLVHTHAWHDAAELVEKAVHRLLRAIGIKGSGEAFECAVEAAVSAIQDAVEAYEAGEIAERYPQTRNRRPTNLTLDVEVLTQLDAWIEAQPIRAGRSAVIERAIIEFLERQEQARVPREGHQMKRRKKSK